MVTKDLKKFWKPYQENIQQIRYRRNITHNNLSKQRNVMWHVLCPTHKQAHITTHDLYHTQLVHNHVTLHHMILYCNVTCITSESYSLDYITSHVQTNFLLSTSTDHNMSVRIILLAFLLLLLPSGIWQDADKSLA